MAIRTFEILGTGNYYLRTIYIFLYVSLQNAKRIHRTSQIRGTSLTESIPRSNCNSCTKKFSKMMKSKFKCFISSFTWLFSLSPRTTCARLHLREGPKGFSLRFFYELLRDNTCLNGCTRANDAVHTGMSVGLIVIEVRRKAIPRAGGRSEAGEEEGH